MEYLNCCLSRIRTRRAASGAHRILGEAGLVDGAVQHRVHASPGVLEGHALAHAVPPPGPTRVNEEALGAMPVQLLLEQVGIPAEKGGGIARRFEKSPGKGGRTASTNAFARLVRAT